MSALVVDASVVVKWFIPEELAEAATRVRHRGYEMVAPDLVHSEAGNAVWKRWRRGELDRAVAAEIVEALKICPLGIYPMRDLIETAWRLSSEHDRSFYDCLYLALAEKLDCPLVTADRKLHAALKGTPAGRNMVWVEDL